MEISHDLEQLAALQKKGILTKKEFEEQKKALLAAQVEASDTVGRKQQIIYVLLAFFLGAFGIHNFYAGYKGRAITQLVLSILSPFTLFLSLIFVDIWVIVNIFRINKDASGRDFIPSRGVQLALGWVKIIFDILIFGGILVIGGIAGYSSALVRYKANEALDYAARVATANYARSADFPVQCDILVPDVPSVLAEAECVVLSNENGSVVLMKGIQPKVMEIISVLAPSQTVVEEDTIGIQF